jgi:hypothetical protein
MLQPAHIFCRVDGTLIARPQDLHLPLAPADESGTVAEVEQFGQVTVIMGFLSRPVSLSQVSSLHCRKREPTAEAEPANINLLPLWDQALSIGPHIVVFASNFAAGAKTPA